MDNSTGHENTHGLPVFATLTPQVQIAASLFLAIVCLGIFVIVLKRIRSHSRANALLLVGSPDAGKTAILSTLVYDRTLPSHTSLQANSSVITLPESKRTLRIIDIPGHPRIRDQFREHLSDAKAIAFVVDASTVSRNGSIVAEHLHNVLHALSSLPTSQSVPSLLIVAHKVDLLKAATSTSTNPDLAINRVKTILERELERRRLSQSGTVGVEGLGAEGERSDMGGLECSGDGAFRFADWEGGEVAFIATAVKVGGASDVEKTEDSLSSLREWLHKNV